MTGNVKEEPEPAGGLKTLPKIFTPGKEDVLDYKKYGEFLDVGTEQYDYKVKNPKQP